MTNYVFLEFQWTSSLRPDFFIWIMICWMEFTPFFICLSYTLFIFRSPPTNERVLSLSPCMYLSICPSLYLFVFVFLSLSYSLFLSLSFSLVQSLSLSLYRVTKQNWWMFQREKLESRSTTDRFRLWNKIEAINIEINKK